MKYELKIKNLSDIDAAAQEFLGILKTQYPDSRCIIFNAGMGVGKTTFIKALCKAMGAVDEASSPTFAIVNDYLCEDGGHIFHFDLYRIKDTEEAMAAGAWFSGIWLNAFIRWDVLPVQQHNVSAAKRGMMNCRSI